MGKVDKINYKQIKAEIAIKPKSTVCYQHKISNTTYYRIKNSFRYNDYLLKGRKSKYNELDYEKTPYQKPVQRLNKFEQIVSRFKR